MLRRRIVLALVLAATATLLMLGSRGFSRPEQAEAMPVEIDGALSVKHEPDIYFYPTPPPVVDKMLELANITADDVVYDLGCGDGRIVIAAAKEFGARGVGIDIDPERIKESRANAKAAGVEHLVEFRQADIFKTDFSDASVVMLYLLPELNLQLVPQLQQLSADSRIVSHAFGIEGYPADRRIDLPDYDGDGQPEKVYHWSTPLKKSRS